MTVAEVIARARTGDVFLDGAGRRWRVHETPDGARELLRGDHGKPGWISRWTAECVVLPGLAKAPKARR